MLVKPRTWGAICGIGSAAGFAGATFLLFVTPFAEDSPPWALLLPARLVVLTVPVLAGTLLFSAVLFYAGLVLLCAALGRPLRSFTAPAVEAVRQRVGHD